MEMVEKLRAVATRKGCTPSQLALAWVLAQGDDVVPIPGKWHAAWFALHRRLLSLK